MSSTFRLFCLFRGFSSYPCGSVIHWNMGLSLVAPLGLEFVFFYV
jgi:hypothetical protein